MTPKWNQSFAEDGHSAVYAPLHLSHRPCLIALHGMMVLLARRRWNADYGDPRMEHQYEGQLGLNGIVPDVQCPKIFHIGQLKGTMRVGKGA